jgi:WD40 repeat protein
VYVSSNLLVISFSAASRVPIQIFKDAKDSVASLVVSSHEILTGSVDGKVRCYDLRMGQLNTDEIGRKLLLSICIEWEADTKMIFLFVRSGYFG